MSISSDLKNIVAAARPLIEHQLDLAEQVAALRDAATAKGLDWSQIKALLKAEIQDERDEMGEHKRVNKIIDKANYASAYADMLGMGKMNEKNFSADEEEFDPITGEVLEDEFQSGGRPSAPAEQAPRLADESGVSISPETATECAAPEKEAVADERDVEATVEQRSSAPIPDGVPAFLTRPNKPLRPLTISSTTPPSDLKHDAGRGLGPGLCGGVSRSRT